MHPNPLDRSEMEQLWKRGALGVSDPATLQQTVWWIISTHWEQGDMMSIISSALVTCC